MVLGPSVAEAIADGVEHRLGRMFCADIARVSGSVDPGAKTLTAQPLSRRWDDVSQSWIEPTAIPDVRYVEFDPYSNPDDALSNQNPTPNVNDMGLLIYLDRAIPSTSSAIATPDVRGPMLGLSGVIIMME